jgi:hypothetical protein
MVGGAASHFHIGEEMIPSIENILRMFKDGKCTLEQALAWIEEHRRLDRLECESETGV